MTEHEGPLDGLRQAYTAYDADPVDVRDRPSAWSALDALLDAVRAVLAASATDEGPHITSTDQLEAEQRGLPIPFARPTPAREGQDVREAAHKLSWAVLNHLSGHTLEDLAHQLDAALARDEERT